MSATKRYLLADMNAIMPVPCPCGSSRRAFAEDPQKLASFHIVKIKQDSHLHYHKKMTEVYYVLAGSGRMEVDGESIPVGPGNSILIKPGCRHRAVGDMTIINVVTPAFDPSDEYIVE
jgi:mannose-6-phosphate isomerase-like protein (cupin superfamily)